MSADWCADSMGSLALMFKSKNASSNLLAARRSFTGSHENHGTWCQPGDAISNASNQVPIQPRKATS